MINITETGYSFGEEPKVKPAKYEILVAPRVFWTKYNPENKKVAGKFKVNGRECWIIYQCLVNLPNQRDWRDTIKEKLSNVMTLPDNRYRNSVEKDKSGLVLYSSITIGVKTIKNFMLKYVFAYPNTELYNALGTLSAKYAVVFGSSIRIDNSNRLYLLDPVSLFVAKEKVEIAVKKEEALVVKEEEPVLPTIQTDTALKTEYAPSAEPEIPEEEPEVVITPKIPVKKEPPKVAPTKPGEYLIEIPGVDLPGITTEDGKPLKVEKPTEDKKVLTAEQKAIVKVEPTEPTPKPIEIKEEKTNVWKYLVAGAIVLYILKK